MLLFFPFINSLMFTIKLEGDSKKVAAFYSPQPFYIRMLYELFSFDTTSVFRLHV